MLEPEVLLTDPDAVADVGDGIQLEHYEGCQFSFTFTAEFGGLPENQAITIPLETSDWTASRTDVAPNW